jgi:putative RecB family exonuclease
MTAETVRRTTIGPDGLPGVELPRQATLSPSRAADFKTCPLLYRLRSIDRIPQRTTADQARGTLVHAVLEQLFDLPAAERTPEAAAALVAPAWQRLLAADPTLADVVADDPLAGGPAPAETTPAAETDGQLAGPAGDDPLTRRPAERPDLATFLDSAGQLVAGYFTVEDPRRLEPAERESLVNAVVDGELLIRGYIDRLDVSPRGDLRVVDYKTGGAPREAFESRALFQLKFYALVLWRTRGVVPRVLRLLYLRDAEVCDYTPDAEELARFERTVVALWRAILQATENRDFRPKPSRLCDWCSYQAHCPQYGGTPPPFPEPSDETVSS